MKGIDLRSFKNSTPLEKGANWYDGFTDLLNKDISIRKAKLDDKKKERFYSGLSVLLSAGIDISSALELAIEQQKTLTDKNIIKKIKDDVENGSSMSVAMQNTNLFSAFEFYSIKIGEESGTLPLVLTDLAKFYTSKIKQTRQIINALSYPLIVVCAAVGAISFMIKFIVPMFADVFKRFKTELPPLTNWVIKFSSAASGILPIIIIFVLGGIVFILTQRNKEWYRHYSSVFIYKLPIVGTIVKKIFLARFCHSMHLLQSAKTPLIESINLVSKMVSYYPIEKSLTIISDDIIHGKQLHDSMKKFPIYDNQLISLIKVGEEVNRLDFIFEKLTKQYSDEVDYQTNILSSLLEPIIIIVLGLIVGVILVAMYLPLFKLSSSFGI